jgi:hypothetical protein
MTELKNRQTQKESEADLVEMLAPRAQGMVRWHPQAKDETLSLMDHLNLGPESGATLMAEAAEVLSRCLPPDGKPGSITGLVVGHVQSGKTMSFTTVAALARDNGYQLVIVIAGTSISLLTQSTERLEQDLRLLSRPDRQWLHISSRTLTMADQTAIRDTLADWREPSVPSSQRRTVLITVMKHHGHLAKVIEALQEIGLAHVPALVIDDEADQASLNSKVKQSEETTTYQRLRELRACLPSHSFLQYTATPQAPLLINIIDTLSPTFAEVLTPGLQYVGGAHFFYVESPYVEIIPDSEIGTPDSPLTEPPESLLYAMQIFFLGVAAGYEKEDGLGSRSMMVHPSQQVEGHRVYSGWVSQTRHLWQQLLKEDVTAHKDRSELIERFREAYKDLHDTVADLPSFDALVKRLPYAVRNTRVETLNAARGATPKVKWNAAYAHIIIGGQLMDRGFTVEGLTVSYMPRSIGVGHADTIQQRARFFGYKGRYLGYCRVFLSNSGRDAYTRYVDHEKHMRGSLIQHRESGLPLPEWKRVFRLHDSLKPTRDAVLDLEYMRGSFGEGWIAPFAPHLPPDAIRDNRDVASRFLAELSLVPDEGSGKRTEAMRHRWSPYVPLQLIVDELLTRLRFGLLEDSQRFTGLQILLDSLLKNVPDAMCAFYDMSRGVNPAFIRKRSLDNKGRVKNLFQGASPVSAANRGSIYRGDRELGPEKVVRVQIHHLDIYDEDERPVADDVTAVAVCLPKDMADDILVQHQPGQADNG